ncbi:AAC(3) family N-acetyltransferase [Actinosynnema sp. NPDC020468]|uniref:AAC(3) family N-acetyltransferase n=1 Tax=Actinosynnema sp. NPDC020468 TaxID=3154488 RepID=UPI0033E277ED
MIGVERLGEAVDEVAVSGRPVLVHAALRSFGEAVDADLLLDVLLGRGCTVLVPSFTEPQFEVDPPAAPRPARNGFDYADVPADPGVPDGPGYDVGCGLVNEELGVFPAVLLRRLDARRGDHPLNSFAAVGPLAGDLVGEQGPKDVYAPIRALAERDGVVLLVGVGVDAMTAIHLAEQRSGRRLLARWALDHDGEVTAVEVGSCSVGFTRLEPVLAPLARVTAVGASTWQAFSAGAVLDAATEAIAADPAITHCPDEDCLRCNDFIAGGPIW